MSNCIYFPFPFPQTGAITNGKGGAPYYVGGSQTLPRGGIYNDRNKNVVGKCRRRRRRRPAPLFVPPERMDRCGAVRGVARQKI